MTTNSNKETLKFSRNYVKKWLQNLEKRKICFLRPLNVYTSVVYSNHQLQYIVLSKRFLYVDRITLVKFILITAFNFEAFVGVILTKMLYIMLFEYSFVIMHYLEKRF